MSATVIVGAQYGDEGKGKITSFLATQENVKAIARAGVGPNAGHTVVHNGTIYKLRLMPSGFFNENARVFIGAGVLISEEIFLKEIEVTGVEGRVYVDSQTGIIEPKHIEAEKANKHLMEKIGSTGSGSGMAYVSRVKRELKLAKEFESMKPYIVDVSKELNDIMDNGGDVIVEGSQATHLSLFHGNYPYVTSKDVSASAALSDVGLGPTRVSRVVAVCKAYVTRVGTGRLDGELEADEIERRGWQEYGTVTGRLRRAAPFDFELVKRSIRLNGATEIALTKMDILYPKLKGVTKLDELKIIPEAVDFIQKIEDYTGVHVSMVSTGPEVEALILRSI